MTGSFEIWIHRDTDTWHQIMENDEPAFASEKRALAIAGKVSQDNDVVEVLVIERTERLCLNGPARLSPSTGFKPAKLAPKKKDR